MNLDPTKTCFVILPGFAPDSIPVLPIQQYLENCGFTAHATHFWGDGHMDFASLTIDQCKEGIASIIAEFGQQYSTVIGIGISLGGALLIEHAKEHSDLDLIVSIGTPFRLRHRILSRGALLLYPLFNAFWKFASRVTAWRPLPIPAMKTIWHFLHGAFLQNFDRVTTPVLFLQSRKDEVVDHKAIDEYFPVFSKAKTVKVFYGKRGHDLGYDGKLILEAITEHFSSSNLHERPVE